MKAPGIVLWCALGATWPATAVRAQSAPAARAQAGAERGLTPDPQLDFTIPAGPLEPALVRFARAAEINLSYAAATVDGATTAGLHGRFATPAGLQALLAGSGVDAMALADGGYILHQRRATPAATDNPTLPAVTVSASAGHDDFLSGTTSVGSKSSGNPHDIAQASTTVSRALLETQGATSFQDALHNVPGITIGGAEGAQIGNNINLRGVTAQSDIYLNGLRDSGQYYRDTFDLEAIDVLYGPSSLLFGRGSTGGVVNQVAKQANLSASGQLSTSIGTDDRYRTTLDVNHPLSDTAAVRLNLFGQDLGSTRDMIKNQDYGIAPSVRFGIGTPTEITLSALIQHNDDMPDFGVPPLDGRPAPVGKSAFFGLSDDRTLQGVQIFSATVKHRFNDNLTLQNRTQWANYEDDIRETGVNAVLTGPLPTSPALAPGNFTKLPLSQLFVRLEGDDAVLGDHTLFNDTDLLYRFDTGFIKHDLDLGIELGRETASDQTILRHNLPVLPLLDADPVAAPPNVTASPGNLAQASANTFAAYVNDTLSLGTYWKLAGGLRWDHFRPEISDTTSAPGFASQTNDFTSKRAGLIFQPGDTQAYYVSYGTSFDPSLEQLIAQSGTQDLAPSTSLSYETGAKWDVLGGNLALTAAVFQVERDHARTEVAAGEFATEGKVRVRGAQGGASGRLTERWQIYAGYTYLDARVLQADDGTAGRVPANTPRNAFTLWSTYTLAPHWQIGGGPTYQGPRFVTDDNLVAVPGYTRWDAMAAYRRKPYEIRLNLLNLSNKTYYSALVDADGGRAIPGSGRTLLATLTYRFD